MNLTFRGDDHDISANACVGENGWVDAETYADGYDIAVRRLCDAAMNDDVPVDAVIYPIAYSARHRLELSLKAKIKVISRVSGKYVAEAAEVANRHDLGALWTLFSEVTSAFDRRYAELIAYANDIVLDFAAIDPTGQTFRYPHDNSGHRHLVKTPVISVRILRNAYLALDGIIRAMTSLTDELVEEYLLQTRTRNLSRRDIAEIAKRLPNRDLWNLDSFDEIRRSIMNDYQISGNELARAIDRITAHQRFATEIGLEIRCVCLTADFLSEFCSLRRKLDAFTEARALSISDQIDRIRTNAPRPEPSEEENVTRGELEDLLDSLSEVAFAELVALSESFQWRFSERFSTHVDLCIRDLRFERPHQQRKIVRKTTFLFLLRIGLYELGQTSLLAAAFD